MKKRGLSHVEAILSFILFIGFLIGAFVFFSPFTSDRTLDTTLSYVSDELEDNATTNIISYSIVLNPSVSGDVAVEILDTIPVGYNSRVENISGFEFNSIVSGDLVHFNIINGPVGFVNIVLSEDMGIRNGLPGTQIAVGDFSISSSDEKPIYSEQKFIDLKSNYDSDYIVLRDEFNLPARVEFGFTINFPNGDIITAERPIPPEFEVFSETEKIEIIRLNGEIVFADLINKVW